MPLTLLNQDVASSMLTLEPTWAGFRDPRIAKWTGEKIPPMYGEVVRGSTINWYMDEAGMDSFIAASRDTLLSNRSYLFDVREQTHELAESILRYDRSLTGSEEPAEVLRKNRELLYEISTWGLVVAFADIHGDITNRNLAVLSQKLGSNSSLLHQYSYILSTPPSSLTERALADIRHRKKSDDELLTEYFWLNQGYVGRGLTGHELESLRIRTAEYPEQFTANGLPDLNLSEEEAYGFEVARMMIETKALRADVRQAVNVITNRIVDTLAGQLGVEPRFLECMTTQELLDALSGGVLPEGLAERWEKSLWVWEDDRYRVYVGTEAETLLSGRFTQASEKEVTAVSGQTAYPGTARGTARLVFGPQHNAKVKENDILISLTTSPQLLPAMARASAFVTGIGGITSHAAIVAREMKKPCIVGARDVTHVVKDGDLVELDAAAGTLKILEQY